MASRRPIVPSSKPSRVCKPISSAVPNVTSSGSCRSTAGTSTVRWRPRSSRAAARYFASPGSRATGRSSESATSRSTCALAPSLAPRARSSRSSRATSSSSIPPRALNAHCAPSAPRRRRAPGEPLRSRTMSSSNIACESSLPRPPGANACASASKSSTYSPTYRESRDAVRATWAFAKTCSIFDVMRPSSTWKPSTAVHPRWLRNYSRIELFVALGGASGLQEMKKQGGKEGRSFLSRACA